MALVDYSDSDNSDTQGMALTKPRPVRNSTKPTFEKRIDSSDPRKIKVTLPQVALEDGDIGEPVAKRAKTGGGAFSGFNSFLPAPKHTGPAATSSNSRLGNKSRGLGVGVNLKTGAAPGFSREPEPEEEIDDKDGDAGNEKPLQGNESAFELPSSKTSQLAEQKSLEETKPVGKPTMFKPLSVARKTVKPKTKKEDASQAKATSWTKSIPSTPKPPTKHKEKINLFSISSDSSDPLLPTTGSLSQADDTLEHPNDHLEASYEDYNSITSFTSQTMPPPELPTSPSLSQPQSLTEIASDLRLTPSERRRLFGRSDPSKSSSAINNPKIINFSTENEYSHNELLRQAAEGQPTHNPVRSIAPGKHSLKQLLGAVQNQKEALEESFSEGKGRRKEAGGRYGW